MSCTVVLDRVYVNGELQERTHDWYAQDAAGNVWYFGESTSEYEDGNVVSREGSWKAGKRGAKPGIVMEADPQVGDAYQRERAAPVALDEARVLSTTAGVKTPFGRFTDCLQTEETTPLEPGIAESKWYARGIGFVRSQTTAGPEDEVVTLVSFVP